MGIQTYETLYESYVDPIMNYASGVWGFRHYDAPRVLQNRIMRFYLGVHKFAPVVATKLEMDWMECREKRWLNMFQDLWYWLGPVSVLAFSDLCAGKTLKNTLFIKS